MLKRFLYLVSFCIALTFFCNCAKRGMPQGGALDSIPPVFVKAAPENFSTQFNAEEIRIYFDEYIKLDNPARQIIVSPPMDPKPEISPLGNAKKYIRVKLLDTLKKNTTYSINFGKSIVDNNEANPYPFFKYVFSTGAYVDSLKISGTVNDAYSRKTDEFISVMLYEIDSTYSDSIVYKDVPTYIGYTQDSTHAFTIENMKEGTYKMVALKDLNNNYTFEPKQDKIGFYEGTVHLPTDSTYHLQVFKEELDFKAIRPKQIAKNHLVFGYEGIPDSTQFTLLSEKPADFSYRLVKDPEQDTIHYWYKPYFEADSLVFKVSNKAYEDTLVTKVREMMPDSLVVNLNPKTNLGLDEDIFISGNIPFSTIDTSLVSVLDKDSTKMAFSTHYEAFENRYQLHFKKEEKQRYKLTLLPGALTDFYEHTNDTLRLAVNTPAISDLATLALTLNNIKAYPVIVQLTNENGEVKRELVHQAAEGSLFDFKNITPGNYYIRVIYDTNNNARWDTGSYLKHQQPEQVIYFPKSIELRANWDVSQTFILD